MSKKIFLLIISACVSLAGIAKENPSAGFKEQKQATICFTENKGQFADQNYNPRPDVLFGGSDGQMAFHITAKGISYQLYRVDKYKEVEDPKFKKKIKEIDQQTIYRTDIKWLNANLDPVIKTDGALEGYSNYYLEQCPNGALQVKSYKGITLQNIYNNIDLHYYEKNGQLKYDYIVAPYADYKQIQLKVEGATLKLLKDGSLLIETPLGTIQEQAPIVFQNGKQLKAHYIIQNNIISFEVEKYNSNYELIIDPVTRLWGTYYGGASNDHGYCCTTDALANVYMTGFAANSSGTVIATSGSHQQIAGDATDVFLVKFNSNGLRLWGTYYGGIGLDIGYSCTTDVSGNVYITGTTDSNSSTVIATVGSHQDTFGGGKDAFLVKFNSTGIRQWGTYYGGTGIDWANSCITDASGNVCITGQTTSNTGTVIATAGSHQDIFGGSNDAFLVKFSSGGLRQWGTYFGGIGGDVGLACTADVAGNIYMAGATDSNTGTVIATASSNQSTYGGGTEDAFLVQFNSSGVRQWGTYYGGILEDLGNSCTTDASGNVYMTGRTESFTSTLIATVGSHQDTFGGNRDGFLVKFNNSGLRLWGTYYGGAIDNGGDCCATDAVGNVYMAGFTETIGGTSIATPGSYQSSIGGAGTDDAFLVKFNSSGVRQSGTYYGGLLDEFGYSCAIDASGKIYMAGYTQGSTGTIIATAGSHQSSSGGNHEAFLVKFDNCNGPLQPSSISGSVIVCSGSSQTYSVTNDASATSYIWSLPAGWSGSSSSNTISATPGAAGIITVTAINPCGPSPQQTLNVAVNPSPILIANTNNTLICLGQMAILTASGAVNYTWNPGAATGASISITPSTSTVYTVTGIAANGCLSTTTVSQSAVDCTGSLEADIENADVLVYPNPFSGMVTIIGAEGTTLTIYNSMGQLIYKIEIKDKKTQIDISKESDGIYFLRLGNVVKKIIKE